MSKYIKLLKAEDRPYGHEDINDLIEDEILEKGRGPDLKERAKRGEAHRDPAKVLTQVQAMADRKASQEVVDHYVEKFKMKHPEGMGAPEARAWLKGAGMKSYEVDQAMTKIKIRKD